MEIDKKILKTYKNTPLRESLLSQTLHARKVPEQKVLMSSIDRTKEISECQKEFYWIFFSKNAFQWKWIALIRGCKAQEEIVLRQEKLMIVSIEIYEPLFRLIVCNLKKKEELNN